MRNKIFKRPLLIIVQLTLLVICAVSIAHTAYTYITCKGVVVNSIGVVICLENKGGQDIDRRK